MPKSNSHFQRHVVILEGWWNDNAEKRLSVAPLLKLLSRRNGTRYVLLTGATVEEFQFNVEVARTVKAEGILLFAFHGFPGGLYLPTAKVTMEDLSGLLKGFGKRWLIFFDSCATLKVEKERIHEFMLNTGVRAVAGFKKKVDWLDAAAVDLLLLDWLQIYKNIPKFWTRFQTVYPDLIEITGLTMHFNGHR